MKSLLAVMTSMRLDSSETWLVSCLRGGVVVVSAACCIYGVKKLERIALRSSWSVTLLGEARV